MNILLKLFNDLYGVCKNNLTDIASAFIHIINFYIGTKNSRSWIDISVGFSSLCLSLFKFESVKDSARYIQTIVGIFINNLKNYFIAGESAEKQIKSFWSDISITNPRTLFGIVHSCSGILTSIICMKSFVEKAYHGRDIMSFVTEVSNGILKVGSEFRQHAENITLLLARIYDWICINANALLQLKFDEIVWELPKDQVFESRFVEISNIMSSFMEDPLYLENENLSLEILRDRLYKLRESGDTELNKNPVPSIKSALTRYMTTIDGYIRFVEARLNPDNTKPQPMSITLLGPAGCGKSSASTKIGLMMQVIAGRVPDENLHNSKGGDPKFEENITGSTDVVIFDDYANDQSIKMATKDVLDIVNTSKEVIPKSRADEKGNHKYNNIGTIFTTNDEDLGINCFKTASVDSILRRLGLVVELSVKDEYCIDGTDRLNVNHPDVSCEIFNTDIYHVELKMPRGVCQPQSEIDESYDSDELEGGIQYFQRPTKSFDSKTVNYEYVDYERHEGNSEWRDAILTIQKLLIEQWDSSVYRHTKSKSTEHLCTSCLLPKDVCMCSNLHKDTGDVDIEVQAESLETCRKKFISIFYDKPVSSAQQCLFALDNFVIDYSSRAALCYSLAICYKNYWSYFLERLIFYRLYKYEFLFLFIILNFIPGGVLLLTSLLFYYERRFFKTEKEKHFERSINLGTYIAESYKARYTAYGICFASSALLLGLVFNSLIAVSKVITCSEDKVLSSDSDISECVKFTDAPKKTNSDSIGYFINKPRPAHEARTMTPNQVLNDIAKGIAVASITCGGKISSVKSLPMGSERLIPAHALSKKDNQDIIIRYNTTQGAEYKNMDLPCTHIQPLVKKNLFKTKYLDASLVHLPNMPPGKDFAKYLAEPGTLPTQAGCTYIHKNCEDGSWEPVLVRARMLDTPLQYRTKSGIETQMVYECEARNHNSLPGDCGQPLIYNNSIIGIHIAGTGSNKWYCLAVDRSTIDYARTLLKNETSIFVASTPPEVVFKNNKKDLTIHDGETSYVTDVLKTSVTPIVSLGVICSAAKILYKPRAEDYYFRNGNEQIEKEFGELSSRPPKYVNGAEQINTTLLKFNTPKMDVPISLMDRAMDDYLYGISCTGYSLAQVASNFERDEPGFFSVRDLSQALDGDGSGIVRGMNNQTSAGVCYGGKKTKWMELGSDGDPLVPRILNNEVEKDIYNIEHKWRNGQGTFDPFVRASKTNEVLPLKKAYEKTRSVYGNDMSFFIAATRGIIPLKHVLRDMNTSECFVGIAAQSDQWENSLYNYITKESTYKNFVCGDFSGYDTQLPKALMEKAAAMIIKIYKENGASFSDLEYLRGFLSSVVSPIMLWEGHILQFCSGQPSGQPLTVEMNSIVNSLLVRMAFFVIMDKYYPSIKNPKFRDYVRLGVYGDDNIMGVDERIPEFNHTNIQAIFGSWGIKYTMADKEADSVPYQSIEEVSFLKRSFCHHKQLDAIVAPIEKESLSKKMYWWTKSKNTPLTFPEQFQANFESQSREAYLHGEEYYLDFVDKCERIRLASEFGDERFALPWNTIQPLSCIDMRNKLYEAYHPEIEE